MESELYVKGALHIWSCRAFVKSDADALAAILRGGGVVAVAHLYFDESGTHRGAKLMTVAGYWFDSGQAARFSRDWAKELKRLGLTHAHMTDCAHGQAEYKKLSLIERVRSEKLLIENIKRRTRFGFAITVDPTAYAAIMEDVRGAPTCYSLCLMTLVNQIAMFAMTNNYQGRLVYFFEAGHESANEANRYLNAIPAHGAGWINATRYGGHAFIDKRVALPLQTADMLAWQTRHYFERLAVGHSTPRKDFVALVRPFDLTAEYSEQSLLALRDSFLELAPLVEQGDNVASAYKSAEILGRYGLTFKLPPQFKC